jgi:hypothetical protein
MMPWIRRPIACLDRFLFESCDGTVIPILRIGFALLVLIQSAVAWIDAERWFTNAGVLQGTTASQISTSYTWSILFWLPSDEWTVKVCLGLLICHAIFLLLGIASCWQSAAIFFWLVSFQNRNPLINDGEDIVFRFMAFMLIWLPLDARWAFMKRPTKETQGEGIRQSSAWGLRLIQIEMTAIYASTALCKAQGETWWNGTAVWFVSRMTDDFGRIVPGSFFDIPGVSAAATWGTLFVELALPIALWIRPLRKAAILAGFGLHLGIELTMNLFLFQWIMMLGLVSFIDCREWRSGLSGLVLKKCGRIEVQS